MHALSVRGLTKIYKNGIVALKGIDLDVAEGDFFALLGQNGAGKSTTIGIICSLINKTRGSVKVFGYDLDHTMNEAKSLIGIVPQEMNFSLFENVSQVLINTAGYYGVPKKLARARAERYLKIMGIWDKRDSQALHLSGGMKRRLMIVRAMMNEPKLLILDEPTAGVDIELRHTLWTFLQELNQTGTTIILTTHYLEEAEQLCKHVAIIDHGEIIEYADMKTLIARLDVQTVMLDLMQPIHTNLNLGNFRFRVIDPLSLEVEIHRRQSLNELFDLLSKENIIVSGMRNKTNRLEELFIYLVSNNHNHAGQAP